MNRYRYMRPLVEMHLDDYNALFDTYETAEEFHRANPDICVSLASLIEQEERCAGYLSNR